ncbi:MAG: hypothetical protein HXX15_03500 [Rhodopseudomonas sp.]|uniref:hypothetical protein n=1 Tax=Rhodopseudomonas sp. TaxID=1078 RepID=UPI00184CA3BD|nr:hypothetical protein [Rhodopseudomonas sp.]NVN85134.1 hypothetical protein [Rhodopseudomonas sp.]
MTIDAKAAAAALSEIDDIARRVRQSLTYQRASLMMILWGALTLVGHLITFAWPRYADASWIAIYVVGTGGSFLISTVTAPRTGVRSFDHRAVAAFVLFIAFGTFACWLGHFGPRETGTFWPLYFMLAYVIVGLWVGNVFVAIGLTTAALTLIGYAYLGPWFELWMAAVNGGGLMLGGLWMRRS